MPPQEFPSDYPERGIVAPQPVDLHQQGESDAGEQVFLTSPESDAPAEVRSSIEDLIETPVEEVVTSQEQPNEPAETSNEGRAEVKPVSIDLEVASFVRRQEDKTQTDQYRVAAEAGEKGKSAEDVSEYFKGHTANLLESGHKQATLKEKYQGKADPNFAVMRIAHKLAKENPDLLEHGSIENDRLKVSINRASAVENVLDLSVQYKEESSDVAEEHWIASVQTGTLHRVISRARENDDRYKLATTTEGEMQDKDVERLHDLVSGAKFGSAEDYQLAA